MADRRPACAACHHSRRSCYPNCIFAPYFPADNPARYADVHRIFGRRNVRRMIQRTEAGRRRELADALHFEARFRRVEDPVGGCAGRIADLDRQVRDLQTQLAEVQTQLAEARAQLDLHHP